MIIGREWPRQLVAWACLVAGGSAAYAAPLASLDLTGPFATRSAWHLTVSQGPDVSDPVGEEDKVPGPVTLCLSKDGGHSCDPATATALVVDGKPDLYSEPHELRAVRIVHPRASRPLLLVQVGSLRSGDGDRRIGTQLFAYDRRADAFHPVYAHSTSHNNNQEVRYIDAGPLTGAIVAAEPTTDAPFGFWITIDRSDATGTYAQALRYRSATRYGDGNTLAVIDSEMPSIARRLGLWHAGQPLPLPASPCPRPHLVRAELWCR
jgi:hypothetical protein